MPAPLDVKKPLRTVDLPKAKPIDFTLVATPDMIGRLAANLGLLELRKLRLTGRLVPQDRHDWHLLAQLGATAVQSCIATGAPVVTRIDTEIERVFVTDWQTHIPEVAEAEMPEDDRFEPLGETIDLEELVSEALALALPDFPRGDTTPPVEVSAAPPGAQPIDDALSRPFSGLAELKRKLEEGN
ncbi:MAG: DUF177 domain-containing protein [Pseudomonadota bacterium]